MKNLLPIFLILSALMGMGGCAASDEAWRLGDSGPSEDDPALRAESRLFEWDVAGANAIYRSALESSPGNPQLLAGKAITDLLLLPYSDSVGALLQGPLAAERTLSQSENVIYRESGVLYLLARGVGFEDGESFPGILTLLETQLPWSASRFDDENTFFGPMVEPLNGLFDALVVVSSDLAVIAQDLREAESSDGFSAYFLPGEVFHDTELNLVINRTELAGLRAILGGVRTVVHFGAAYEWSASLSEIIAVQDEARYDLISSTMFRDVRSTEELLNARDALLETIGALKSAVEYGVQDRTNDIVEWGNIEESFAQELIEVLGAAEQAIEGQTVIPYTSPATQMDLSPLWSPGLTLDAETHWFFNEPEFGWQLSDDALKPFFFDQVFDPTFESENPPTLEFSQESEDFTSLFFGDFESDLRVTYF